MPAANLDKFSKCMHGDNTVHNEYIHEEGRRLRIQTKLNILHYLAETKITIERYSVGKCYFGIADGRVIGVQRPLVLDQPNVVTGWGSSK